MPKEQNTVIKEFILNYKEKRNFYQYQHCLSLLQVLKLKSNHQIKTKNIETKDLTANIKT